MRNYRDAASTQNPTNSIRQARPFMLDVTGLARHKVRLENTARIATHTDLDEIAGEMGTADQTRIFGVPHGSLEAAGITDFLQFRSHALGSIDAPRTYPLQAGVEHCITGIEIESEDMNLRTAPLDRNFNAIHETHPCRIRCLTRLRQPAQRVVIGQRQQFNAIGDSPPDQFGRRQDAVGGGGMTMEIDFGHEKRR